MTLARAVSNIDSSEDRELVLVRDGSGGFSRMKSIASSRSATSDLQAQPYLVRSLAASSLWQILKPSRASLHDFNEEVDDGVAVVGLCLDSV